MQDSYNDEVPYGDYPEHTSSHSTNANSTIDDLSSFSFYSWSSYFEIYDFGLDSDDRSVLYIVTFFILLPLVIFGLLGNVLQLYGIVAFPRLRTNVPFIFIANMTIVDILYLLSVGVVNLVFCGCQAFGSMHIILVFGSVSFNIYLQILHTIVLFHLAAMVTALAYDQYLEVVYPTTARRMRTPKAAVIACVILWIVSLLVALADGMSFLYLPFHADLVIILKDILIFLLFCIVPLILTIIFSIITWSTLRKARTAMACADNTSAKNAQRFTQFQEDGGAVPGALVRVQDLPNAIGITVSFVICWVIYHIVHLTIAFIWALKRFHHSIYENNKDVILMQFADAAATFNVALNPFFFAVCNPKFWQHLSRVVIMLVKGGRRGYEEHIDQTAQNDCQS